MSIFNREFYSVLEIAKKLGVHKREVYHGALSGQVELFVHTKENNENIKLILTKDMILDVIERGRFYSQISFGGGISHSDYNIYVDSSQLNKLTNLPSGKQQSEKLNDSVIERGDNLKNRDEYLNEITDYLVELAMKTTYRQGQKGKHNTVGSLVYLSYQQGKYDSLIDQEEGIGIPKAKLSTSKYRVDGDRRPSKDFFFR